MARPTRFSEPATAQLQARITPARKLTYQGAADDAGQTLTDWLFTGCELQVRLADRMNAYKQAAQQEGKTLADWIIEACDSQLSS